MNLVFFAHPSFLGHQSMPRFAKMLADGMAARGHHVEISSPKARFVNLNSRPSLKKWLGYIDQYLVFPLELRSRLKRYPPDTLFVFTDQALGPWVPQLANRHHVIHCHDFMALRSSLGEIPENPTGWTGKQYQSMIRRGFSAAKNFISVSQKTRQDLHRFLPSTPYISEMVYNGLNQLYIPEDATKARELLGIKTGLDLKSGFLLHVGGNQWYKNRSGVIQIYDAWRTSYDHQVPLLLIGESPTESLLETRTKSIYKSDIHFLSGIDDNFVRLAYNGASVFLFPSFAEGFGWPIAEAMASGCPVVTTNEAPMTEVAGTAGFLIPRQPTNKNAMEAWLSEAALTVNKVVELTGEDRKVVVEAGLENAKRFDSNFALDKIENIYQSVIKGD